jgi:hypothetical protein
MADISQSNFAKIVFDADDVYRVTASGTATVTVLYGAPAGTTTITANSVTFGPYGANASVRIEATSGTCSYSKIEGAVGGAITTVTASRALTTADSGNVLRCSAAVTLEYPEGLSAAFSCIVEPPASGDVTLDPTGSCTANGGTTNLTRSRANNPAGFVIRALAANVFGVSGS